MESPSAERHVCVTRVVLQSDTRVSCCGSCFGRRGGQCGVLFACCRRMGASSQLGLQCRVGAYARLVALLVVDAGGFRVVGEHQLHHLQRHAFALLRA